MSSGDAVRPVPGDVDRLEAARSAVAGVDSASALDLLRDLARRDDRYRAWSAGARLLRRIRLDDVEDGSMPVRVGIVGTSTLDQLGDLLPLAGLACDLDVDVHVAGFGLYETELLDPSSELHSFRPHVIVLAPDRRAVQFPSGADDPTGAVDIELGRWTAAWQAARSHSEARLLQLNFVPPSFRPTGGLDAKLPGSRRNLFLELNRRLAEAAGSDVHIVDAFGVAFDLGLRRFEDDRFWFHSKQAVSLGALPALAMEITSATRAVLGRSRKCLVTDLDNTLWGGVVGEDGVENLRLGNDPTGEAFQALQAQLRDWKDRGVLLAVCSKNDEHVAREVFETRDDMVLSLDDFVAFRANWDPKPDNLRALAAELTLGLDSFVFLDDNPAEREFIRRELPEVDVIDLPEDPSGYVQALTDHRGFDVAQVLVDDAARTDQYRARAAASGLAEESSSMEEFLSSLEMVAVIRPIDVLTIDRVTQLVNKSNQWNLTTKRRSIGEIRQLIDQPDAVTLTATLRDRFADHGLVAVLIASQDGPVLDIDTFLMSCRVIGRMLEHAMLERLRLAAAERSAHRIDATFLRSSKNSLVEDLYGRCGFRQVEASERGSRWQFEVGADVAVPNEFIEIRSGHAP